MTSIERPEADSLEQHRPVAVEEDERPTEFGLAEVDPADADDQHRSAAVDEEDYPPA